MLALALTLLSATPVDGVPAGARDRYQDAVKKLSAKQYGPANDVLNQLASEFPRVAEVFASRCSAQLGLQHWSAAEADCSYTLALKQLPTAVYGLAVAQDGQGKFGLAIQSYRRFAGMPDATAALKQQATSRADLLTAQTNAVAPPPPPPPAAKQPVAAPLPPPPLMAAKQPAAGPPPPPPVEVKAPPGGAKGQFVPAIPDPNEGLLYVYRNGSAGAEASTTLHVDNTRIGELWNERYFEVHVKAGGHRLYLKSGGAETSLPIDVEEGTISYVKVEADGTGFKLAAIGKEGRKEIREHCELVYSKKL